MPLSRHHVLSVRLQHYFTVFLYFTDNQVLPVHEKEKEVKMQTACENNRSEKLKLSIMYFIFLNGVATAYVNAHVH